MGFDLTRSAFKAGQSIPIQFTCDGQQVSPPLVWSGAPPQTATFALIADDPDAPRGTFTHWVLFNIPGDVDHLDEQVPPVPVLDNGAVQGRNDFGGVGYGAPCPPMGAPHRYPFTLYPLDPRLPLQPSASRHHVLDPLRGPLLPEPHPP